MFLYFLPFAVSTFDTQSGNANGGGILQMGLAPQFSSFFGRHFSFGDLSVTFVMSFHGRVQAVGSMDGGNGSLDQRISR